MAESISIYSGKYSKKRKEIVQKDAEKQGFRSLSDFIWAAIKDKLTDEGSAGLLEIEIKEKARI